ncbi:MAG: hypothetical protein HS126_37565 [Anaerolineales bacterium]|nr:hypothetical protein [Anaerolineales bacterium]
MGLHNGGMVVTGSPIIERVPTEPAAMPERFVVQWDKEALETVELVKLSICWACVCCRLWLRPRPLSPNSRASA